MGVDFKIDILLLFLCQVSIIQSVTVPLTCWNTKSSYPESELVSSLLKNENPDLFSLIKTKKDTNKFEIDNIRKRLQGNNNSQKPQKMKTPDPSSWIRRNLDVDTTKPPDPTRSSTQGNNFNLDLLKYEHFDPTARAKDIRSIEIDNTPKTFTEGSHLKNELLRYGNCKLIPPKTESDIRPFEVDFRNFNQGNNERPSTIIKAEEDLKQSNGIKTVLQNPLQEVSNRVQNSGIRFPSNVVQTSPAFFTCTQPNLQAAQSCLVQNPKLNDELSLQESSLQTMKGYNNLASNNFPPLPMDYKVVNRFETPRLQVENLNDFSTLSSDYRSNHVPFKAPEISPPIKSPLLINTDGFPKNYEIDSIIPENKYSSSILTEPTIAPCVQTLPTGTFAVKNNIENYNIFDPISNRNIEVCTPTTSLGILEDRQILEPTIPLKSLPNWETIQKVNDAYKANKEVITPVMSPANIVKANSAITDVKATPLSALPNTISVQNTDDNVIILPIPITSIHNRVIPSDQVDNPFNSTSIQLSLTNNMDENIAITTQSNNPYTMSLDNNIANIQPLAIPNFPPNVLCELISPEVLNRQKLEANALLQSNNSPMNTNNLNALPMYAVSTPNIVVPENQMTNTINSGRLLLIPVANRGINTAITSQPNMCFKYKESEDSIKPLEIPNSLQNGPYSSGVSDTSAINSDKFLITEENEDDSMGITPQPSKCFNAEVSEDIEEPLAIPNSVPGGPFSLDTSETPIQQRGVDQALTQTSNAPINTNNLNEYSMYTGPIIVPSNSVFKSNNEYYTDYLSNYLNKLVPELTSNVLSALLANTPEKPIESVSPSLISPSEKILIGPTPKKSLDYFTYPIINPSSTPPAYSERDSLNVVSMNSVDLINLLNCAPKNCMNSVTAPLLNPFLSTAYFETPVSSSIPVLYLPNPSVESLACLNDLTCTKPTPNTKMSEVNTDNLIIMESSMPYIASITINVMPPKEPRNNIVIVI